MKDYLTYFKRLSISQKLAFWYGASLFVMLGIFGYFLYNSFHDSIHHNYDRHLMFEVEQLLPFINTSEDSLSINLSGYSRNEALQGGVQYGTYVRLFNDEGRLIYKSPNYSDTEQSLKPRIPSEDQKYSYSSEWQDLPARIMYYPLKTTGGELAGWLEVIGFEWTLHEELNRFRQYLIVLISISMIFSLLGGYWLSRKALSPVSSIIETAKTIGTTDLDKRIPVNFMVRDELTELASTFNMMLNRLQKGFEREKRFTSDAAHELMTPIASLRSEAEIMLRRPRSTDEYEETLQQILHTSKRMSEMVHLLLQLSRVEAMPASQTEETEIGHVARAIAEKYREKAHSKSINFDIDIHPPLPVRAHRAYIEEIITNLVENSLKYTPEGGKVTFQLQRSSGKAVLHLSDNGIGFDRKTKKHLFERFYRSGQVEVQEQTGSGLGLPLVKAIVNHYGGKIRAYSDGPGTGSTFVVEFPLAKNGTEEV